MDKVSLCWSDFIIITGLIFIAGVMGQLGSKGNADRVIEEIQVFSSQLDSLESRIAKQDSLLQHHTKKAEFDSTNQANQKRVK